MTAARTYCGLRERASCHRLCLGHKHSNGQRPALRDPACAACHGGTRWREGEVVRLVVAKATRLLACVFVVLSTAKVLFVFRDRVQLAPKRTQAWNDVVSASRRRRRRRRRLPLAQIAGLLASLLLLIPVTLALLLLVLFVSVYALRRRRRRRWWR